MDNSGVALITGASSGIGRALAEEFAKHGHPLVLLAEREELLATAANELEQRYGITSVVVAADLTQPEAPERIAALLAERGIVVDILVNNAGVGQRELFHQTPVAKDIEILRLDIEAVVRLTKLFVAPMVAKGRGRILNLGSVAGFQPGPLLAVYHAAKAFVVSFSEAIREELKDSGVSVTVLCPGPTDTDFFARADMEDARIVHDGVVMAPEPVAAVGYKAVMDGEGIAIPGMSNKMLTFTRRLASEATLAKFNRKMYEVKAE